MSHWVTNINGTETEPCKCGSWLQHWERVSGVQCGACAEIKCGKLASEGALVQKSFSKQKSWFVIPLCPKHNSFHGGSIEIVEYIQLVSADKKQTCEL